MEMFEHLQIYVAGTHKYRLHIDGSQNYAIRKTDNQLKSGQTFKTASDPPTSLDSIKFVTD